MSDFSNYLTNSNYVKAYGFNNKGIVYIENERDLSFWEKMINEIHPERYEFKRAVIEGSSIRGKRALEKLYENLNEDVLVAIDSDFDYLSPNRNKYSKHVNENKFLLHTFSFSRESVLCNPKTLNHVLSCIKYFIPSDYKFDAFIIKLSKICYNYLLPFCYLMEKNIFVIDEADFHKPLSSIKNEFHLQDWPEAESKIKELTQKLMEKITNQIEYKEFVNFLHSLGVNEETAYRYISGHVLKDDIIDTIIHDITIDLKNSEIEVIKKECTGKMIHDRIKALRNHFESSCSFNTLLENSNTIEDDEVYIKIITKIKSIPSTT